MNRVTKGVLIISLLTNLISSCGLSELKNRNTTKFDWYSTESAPEHYPMEIISGDFIYKGETERGLYIPSGGP